MENPRNKSVSVYNKETGVDYFNRFTKLHVYTYNKPNEDKLQIGVKPEDVKGLFEGITSSTHIDQSALQYYIILALQDFYSNFFIPMYDDVKALKEELKSLCDKHKALIDECITMNEEVKIQANTIERTKTKNDERFELIVKNMQSIADKLNTGA